jgi:hypothetical protein
MEGMGTRVHENLIVLRQKCLSTVIAFTPGDDAYHLFLGDFDVVFHVGDAADVLVFQLI